MPRRLFTATALGLATAAALAAGPARARGQQVPFARDLMPTREALARVGLERAWSTAVPLSGTEKVIAVTMNGDYVFAQTNGGNFHVFDAENGRRHWSKNIGPAFPKADEPAVTSNTVFVTNGSVLLALDKKTGRTLWSKEMGIHASSPVGANEERAVVGLHSGKIIAYNLKDLRSKAQPFGQSAGSYAYSWQTNSEITSRPIPADQVLAVASKDGRLYVFIDAPEVRSFQREGNSVLLRWKADGPITASMGTYGVRTLLIPSLDKNLYAVDLFDGETKWVFASGAPIDAEPLVGDDDVFVVNTQGALSAVNAHTGEARWTFPSGAARLLAVGGKRVYARTFDGDLVIMDRATGALLHDARATSQRAGLRLRPFNLAVTNSLNDRVYLGTSSGMIVALRELGELKPRLIRHPSSVPFGHVGKENAAPGLTPPAQPPADTKADDAEKPAAKKADEKGDDGAGDEPK